MSSLVIDSIDRLDRCKYCHQLGDINYINDRQHCWTCQYHNIPRDTLLEQHKISSFHPKYPFYLITNNSYLKNHIFQYLYWILDSLPNTTLLELQ